MRAISEEVEGNRVRLSVEIDEAEVERVLDEAVRTISRRARVPGFRPGKVPRQVLEARMGGAGALRSEALREAIPDFYARALADAAIDPISTPEIDITDGEQAGALSFDALVEVRPAVAIPGYKGLRVTVPSPVVAESEVDAQIDRMRETDAELVEVTRPARDRDHLTIDVRGTRAGDEVSSVEDLLYEVGSDRIPGLDDQLRGAVAGGSVTFSVAAEPGGQEPAEAGAVIEYQVLVKDLKEKRLPAVTDDWAAESSEHQSVEELRADLRARLARVKSLQARFTLRAGATVALAELVDDADVPDTLVEEQLREGLSDFGRQLDERKATVPMFLEMTGQSEEQLLEGLRREARERVKVDLSLRALAREESLEVTGEELDTRLEAMATELHLSASVLRDRLTHAGRMSAVRSEQQKAKALAWLLEHVDIVDEEGAPVPREQLTNEGSEATSGGEIDAGGGALSGTGEK